MDVYIAGVDEAGRGPWAGPVIAAAVIFHPERPIIGVKDSKKLSPLKRAAWYEIITQEALAYGIGRADADEIDRINILQATLRAMERAVLALSIQPTRVLIDGNRCPLLPYKMEAVVRGDETVSVISAASILAKVTRDREMEQYDRLYPGFDFAAHKGYGTASHLSAMRRLGITPIHRKSFAPVHALNR